MDSRISAGKPDPPASTVPPQVQRFSIRVPKNNKKKYSVMRFNAGLKVDFKEWKQVKMERENNMKNFRGMEDEMPKFGAGSEFGRAAREEARRKKFGITSRKYKSEDQPWVLTTNGKSGKKFKGVKEGGVSENAAYYIFSHAANGTIEAFPLHEWYKFQIVQRYKTLSAEEAEEEFSKRDKVMNYFSLMLKKRLRNDEEDADDAELIDGETGKKPSKKKEKDFKISEMDEWMESDDDDDDSDIDDKENRKNSDDENDAKTTKKKGKNIKKKKRNASDDEAFEESDDGDEEGRELDYISDSSASDSELEQQKEIKSVAEESGLRQLLASDEEDETEENKDKKSENDKKDDEQGKDETDKEKIGNDDNKKTKKKNNKLNISNSSSDIESGSEKNKAKGAAKLLSTGNSRDRIPIDTSPSRKRTLSHSPVTSQAKKLKLENNYSSPSYISGSSETGITEDAVRRYLMRKPMTTTELLQKFKSKKTGLSSEKIVTIMTNILKNINPTSQKIKGKMYFSVKPHN